MGLELPGSFQGLSSGVWLLVSFRLYSAAAVRQALAAALLPMTIPDDYFYEMIVMPVRIAFAKNSEVLSVNAVGALLCVKYINSQHLFYCFSNGGHGIAVRV